MNKTKRRFLSILLSLALMLGLMSGMTLTAYADNYDWEWNEDKHFTEDAEYNLFVMTDKSIQVTIDEGKTVLLNEGIQVSGTLIVKGKGKLIVKGSDGDYEGDGGNTGFFGNLLVDGPEVTITGGNGADASDPSEDSPEDGGHGGEGLLGNVIVKSGSISVTGGQGGHGNQYSNNGGNGISGSLIMNGGSATVNGGKGGWGWNDGSYSILNNVIVRSGSAVLTGGNWGNAVLGRITGDAEESEDNSDWKAVSGNESDERYVKVTGNVPVIKYPLWVSGVQVTNYNQDDVLDDDPVNCGKVSYTPAAGTTPAALTLNNANITKGYPDTLEESGIYYNGADALEIVLAEGSDNIIAKSEGDFKYCGIYSADTNAAVTISGTGKLTAKGSDNGIKATNNLTINGGNVSAIGAGSGINAANDVTIKGGTVNATATYDGGSHGIIGRKNVTIEGGDVTAYATGSESDGIKAYEGIVNISGGNVIASGKTQAIVGNLKNSIAGIGWTNTEGTEGQAEIAVNTTGQTLSYKKVQFTAVAVHTHNFTYSVRGATITATCNADGCTLDDGTEQHKHAVTLTIVKPTLTTYGQTGEGISTSATLTGLTDFNTATGLNVQASSIIYWNAKIQDGEYKTDGDQPLTAAPTSVGNYLAKITVNNCIASVGYTIAKADPTANAPTGLTATYGQTLADVTLTNPTGNTAGTWAWAVATTTSVGDVGSNKFKANFTPTDTTNYNSKNNVDVTVTVGKADNPATVTDTASVIEGGNTFDLAANVTKNGAAGDVSYEISGEANGCSLNGSVLTSGNTTGTVTVNVTVAADANYNALAATPITVTINEKQTQTITADDVTVTFGDTGKSITATTDGGGDLSYAVKSGDAVTVDASTGALTIVKAGNAVITVTAAETATYAQATKDVNITVNQVNSSGKVTAVSGLVYDGTAKALVDSNVHGGIFMYRLGTDGEWTEDIPEAADFGTYTVYYYIKGDGNHKDNGSETEPMGSVDVTIKCPYSNEWVDGKWYNKNGSQTYKPLGDWKKDGKDWMYVDTSGWYPKNRWQKIDFKWYFFDKEGHMLKDAYQKDASGKIWYIGKNGAWDEKAAVIGWKQDSKGWWFGLYGKDYLKNTWKMINGNWYYFKADGYVAQNEFVNGWWCNKNGVQRDPVKYSWHKTSKGWWYGVSGGWYAKNATYTIDGKSYTFDKMGYQK